MGNDDLLRKTKFGILPYFFVLLDLINILDLILRYSDMGKTNHGGIPIMCYKKENH